jgi:hypothetical protein
VLGDVKIIEEPATVLSCIALGLLLGRVLEERRRRQAARRRGAGGSRSTPQPTPER